MKASGEERIAAWVARETAAGLSNWAAPRGGTEKVPVGAIRNQRVAGYERRIDRLGEGNPTARNASAPVSRRTAILAGAYGLVITTLLVLQTRQLNRHSPPPSSRGTKTLRCIRTSQVAHFGLGILVTAAVCMSVTILAAAGECRWPDRVLSTVPVAASQNPP
jgi:hypothetical protein